MAYDIFLGIPGVVGDSTTKGFENWHRVYSFSWGATNEVVTGGGGAGKVTFSDLTVMLPAVQGNPRIMLAVSAGTHFDKIQLVGLKQSADRPFEVFRYILQQCAFSAFQLNGNSGGDDRPMASASITFGVITEIVGYQDATGASKADAAWWSLISNKGGLGKAPGT